ncbi:MAG: type II toxin-antitoxin system VapB family antitoxin [Proteobacteria bacterium]|nr:type II toxin-antitoxin system VapB family antitoxin [Pseudomonadota bacterium]
MNKTASIFKNGKNQVIRLPKEFEFKDVLEVIISKEGNSIILTPKRKSWSSFLATEKADESFMEERHDIIEDGRVVL